MIRPAVAAVAIVAMAGCTRGVGSADPTISAGVPPAVSVAVVDFPSEWLAREVGGDAAEVQRITPAQIAGTDADLVAYLPGIDDAVDEAVKVLPEDRVVDLTDDISRVADPRDPDRRDPYVWFDPINVGVMGNTLAAAMWQASSMEYQASQYYGLRAIRVQTESLTVDQRLQERLNPCRIQTLVVEAPVLGYLAKAYAFDQIPLISWHPTREKVRALYYTLDAEPAVHKAARAAGVAAVPVDTLTEKAPEDDLLQGIVDVGNAVAAHQDCPLVEPRSTDRPG